ncbi:MAG: permease-like cell division protein FtsX [Chthonomonadales bacterium]
MSLSSISFLMGEAARDIRRNGLMSVAALTTSAISLTVLGGALFTLYRLHQFADAQPRRFEISVFLRPEVPRAAVKEIRRRIQSLPPVERVTLFTKEQAYTELQQADRESSTAIVAALGGANPLPDRLDVRLRDPSATGMIAAVLQDRARFPEVDRVRTARDALQVFLGVQRIVRNVGGGLAALLFIGTAFVIQNTIRLTVIARRREIRIMQLVGATPGFIRMPLVLEGMFYGVFGALVAGGVVLFVVAQVSSYGRRIVSPLAHTMPPAVGPWTVMAVLVAIGALLGSLGSALSIRRFLKAV